MQIDNKKLQEIAKKYELVLIILFGSYARGHANPESDVDIAVRTKLREHDWQWEFDLIRDLVFAFDLRRYQQLIINYLKIV
jgi:predicted nucleotidyltransferase